MPDVANGVTEPMHTRTVRQILPRAGIDPWGLDSRIIDHGVCGSLPYTRHVRLWSICPVFPKMPPVSEMVNVGQP